MKAVYFACGLLLLSLIAVRIISWRHYILLIREDGPVEYLTGIFYFVTAIFLFRTARVLAESRRIFLTCLFYVLSMVFVIITLEEISWGQRLFSWETPEIINEQNTQREINIHNLNTVQPFLHGAYLIVATYGFISGVVGKLISRYRPWNRFDIKWLTVPTKYAFLFLPTFVFYFAYEYLRPELEVFAGHQEPAELFLSLGCFLVALDKFDSARAFSSQFESKPAPAK